MRPWPKGGGSARGRVNLYESRGKSVVDLFLNPAVIAILVFIVAIFILNVVEFGRPD